MDVRPAWAQTAFQAIADSAVPNLAFELDHLTKADVHIAAAECRIEEMRSNIQRFRELSLDTAASEAVLLALEDGLQILREHRQLIAAVIEGIRSGELPST